MRACITAEESVTFESIESRRYIRVGDNLLISVMLLSDMF